MRKNLLITMSGGTTSVINATLVGIIKAVQESSAASRVIAGVPGIKGVLQGSLFDLTDLSESDLKALYFTPASGFIGTTRIRPMDRDKLELFANILDAYDIGYFINIGGNGTIKQSMQISNYLSSCVNIASIAKTVDNDLGDMEFNKVLYTPGFPSCVNYWRNKLWIMNQENLGACEHDKVLVAQTFGRKTGFLAGCARVGDKDRQMPLVLLLPEDQRPLDEVFGYIKSMVAERGRAMVIMSEGYDLGDIGERYDLSGQVMYGTSKTTAAQLLVNYCTENGIQARAFIPGFDQRSDINFVSALDLQRALCVGRYTAERLFDGQKDFLGSIGRSSFSFHRVQYTAISFDEIDDYSRIMPDHWIMKGAFDVTDDYVLYVDSLLDNESVVLPKRNGKLLFAKNTKPNVKAKQKNIDKKVLLGKI